MLLKSILMLLLVYPLEVIFTNPVCGTSAGILILGFLMRLVALFKPSNIVIWGISGGLGVLFFGLTLLLLVFAAGMAERSVHFGLTEMLWLIVVPVAVTGTSLLSFYYWRYVWPVCIVGILVGIFMFGGLDKLRELMTTF